MYVQYKGLWHIKPKNTTLTPEKYIHRKYRVHRQWYSLVVSFSCILHILVSEAHTFLIEEKTIWNFLIPSFPKSKWKRYSGNESCRCHVVTKINQIGFLLCVLKAMIKAEMHYHILIIWDDMQENARGIKQRFTSLYQFWVSTVKNEEVGLDSLSSCCKTHIKIPVKSDGVTKSDCDGLQRATQSWT